ncbi:MAG: hypothetical protein AAFP20_05845 [Cyanobacteria bacterium J06614_10]
MKIQHNLWMGMAAFMGIVTTALPLHAETIPPAPNSNRVGDFAVRTGHLFWTVVDPDENGLSCRWSPDAPADWYSPAATFSDRAFYQWPAVRSFDYGTVLTANITPAGFATLTDSRGLPWLKVRQGDNDEICLVRANASYILPLP